MNYKTEVLNDYSQLNEIHLLVKKAYISSGILSENYKGNADFYPHLNKIPETKIIVAKKNNKIIGTNSITIDGKAGLHTDKYFKKETDYFRKKENKILGSSWRIATSDEYRKDIRLFLDLIRKTFLIATEKNIETCLFIFRKKHENFYKKLLDAEKISERIFLFAPYVPVNYVLMKTDTENTKKHLLKKFSKRKFV